MMPVNQAKEETGCSGWDLAAEWDPAQPLTVYVASGKWLSLYEWQVLVP